MTYRYYEASLFLLRIVLGITFLVHGIQKITNFDSIIQYFASAGLPGFLPYFAAAVETGGGILLILGLLTRLAGLAVTALMIGAILTVKLEAGFIGGYELDVMYMAVAIALILSGSHIYALDNLLQKYWNRNSN
ncbi:DoxX family protein [Pectinatus haikarae]|uniref:Membrane protein YphA (DoxX/SURF4 family) n=1 Tax=Pectinatus haikarae TaxID=349096 RepID=A0ABT9Y3Z3_9FIRM|nr:DoxX family protein [Pectinatus haikarae]MDQ0202549.1 putative membrane protein YphA (DoxX/SURF4 family) [Pectinatus haikarae]